MDPMNPVEEELALLAQTQERLARVPPPSHVDEVALAADLERLKDDIRTAKTEDKPAIEQQYEQMGRLAEQLRKGRTVDEVDPDSPYFAHLRTTQEGRTSDVLIGKATCLEEGLRIVDWRHAPIARLYYQYQEGEEYEEDMGRRTVSGQLLVRRTVSIARGQLDRVSSPKGTWIREDEDWQELSTLQPRVMDASGTFLWHRVAGDQRLGTGRAHRADKHLPDIAALIDKEQFDLIARPDSGPVLIRGGAGSGKTTVALHRIAWLAHQNPARFAPLKMLVVVFGRALRDYVSKVLPGLGVKNVPVTTWYDWARRLASRHFPALPDHRNANTPSIVSRFKLHPRLPVHLERIVRSRKAPATPSSALDDWRFVTSDRNIMADLGFTPEEVDKIADTVRGQQLQIDRLLDREKDADPWLDEEDDAILLRAWQLRIGPLKAKGGGEVRHSHIAVDEAQDFSGMELSVLIGTLDKHRCLTLAGDTQQHIQEVGGSTDWGELLGILGIPTRNLSTLRISYRSTRPITAFSRMLLGPDVEDDAAPLTTRDGPPVEIFPFPDHGACVEFLGRALRSLVRTEPNASVALLTPNPELSRLYYDGLSRMDLPGLRLVTEQQFAFIPGIDVVDVQQVKGLEFDYVVVLEASDTFYMDRPYTRRLLHVASSRAIQQLWITVVGRASVVLPGQNH